MSLRESVFHFCCKTILFEGCTEIAYVTSIENFFDPSKVVFTVAIVEDYIMAIDCKNICLVIFIRMKGNFEKNDFIQIPSFQLSHYKKCEGKSEGALGNMALRVINWFVEEMCVMITGNTCEVMLKS